MAYLESLLTYDNDAAESHLRRAYWELDEGDFKFGECSKPAELSNTGFCPRWIHVKKSQDVHTFGAFMQIYVTFHNFLSTV